MKIFWSWQSDTPASTGRNFVKSALEAAITQVADEMDLSEAERPSLDHDTKDVPGLAAIADTIFQKIDSATLFIADISLTGSTPGGKKTPNPNVLIELGYAMKSPGFECIILVANTAHGYKHEDLPFDLRHRRGPITYELAEGSSKELKSKIQQRLISDLFQAIHGNIKALSLNRPSVSIPLQQSHENNRSIWFNRHEPIQLPDKSEHQINPTSPLAYLRVIPSGWKSEKPPRYDIQSSPPELFGRWSIASAMYPNKLGSIKIGWKRGNENDITASTQWIDRTGELWGASPSYLFEHNGENTLATIALAKDWKETLHAWIRFFESFEATKPYTVEAGIVGFEGVSWPNDNSSRINQCMDPEIYYLVSGSDWGEEAQLQFLTGVFSRICDSFSLPRMLPDQVYALAAQ